MQHASDCFGHGCVCLRGSGGLITALLLRWWQDSGKETPATRAANPHRGAEHVRNTAAAASAKGGFMGKVFAVRLRASCCPFEFLFSSDTLMDKPEAQGWCC